MFHSKLGNSQPLSQQRGSGIMMAVFIILFFTAMAAAIVKLQTTAGDAVVVEVYSARALNAANSGAGSTIEDILFVSGAAACVASNPSFSGNGLQSCQADVQCTTLSDPSSGIEIYRVQSTGRCSFDNDTRTASRTVVVEVKN